MPPEQHQPTRSCMHPCCGQLYWPSNVLLYVNWVLQFFYRFNVWFLLPRLCFRLGAEFFKTNRGGLITFHGPGQLVVYPIVYLKQLGGGVRWYVASLETAIINCCRQYMLKATTSVHTGVWVNDRKICAIGVHGSQQVMTHGLALNCSIDLDWFSHIVPCGIEGKGVTSITQELGRTVTPTSVIPKFLKCVSEQFNCQFEDIEHIYTIDHFRSSL